MSDVIKFNFHGDELHVVNADGRVWVSVRRVCEALGLGYGSQLQKLKKKSWATITMTVTVAADGKSRETACVDLKALPMWLGNIEAERVADHVRPKLDLYQREAAEVLADHFLGKRGSAVPAPKPMGILEDLCDRVRILEQRPMRQLRFTSATDVDVFEELKIKALAFVADPSNIFTSREHLARRLGSSLSIGRVVVAELFSSGEMEKAHGRIVRRGLKLIKGGLS